MRDSRFQWIWIVGLRPWRRQQRRSGLQGGVGGNGLHHSGRSGMALTRLCCLEWYLYFSDSLNHLYFSEARWGFYRVYSSSLEFCCTSCGASDSDPNQGLHFLSNGLSVQPGLTCDLDQFFIELSSWSTHLLINISVTLGFGFVLKFGAQLITNSDYPIYCITRL